MDIINQYHEIVAVFIARAFLGCLFFFQGVDAVFKVKLSNVVTSYHNTFANSGIPKIFTVCAAWFTYCSALVCGAFLIFGLFEYIALYILGINLIVTAIGFGINTPLWDTKFVFPRLALLILLLAVPASWHGLSMDHMIFPILPNNS